MFSIIRELLEFYRHKIVEYDSEYQQLFKKLENYSHIEQDLVSIILANCTSKVVDFN